MERTLFIGDVHACSEELANLCQLVQPTQVYLVGDLFTKGPDPIGVWELIQSHQMQSVLGNHDVAARQLSENLGLPKAARKWLYGLPIRIDGKGWTLVHAGIHPKGGLTTQRMATMMRYWTDGRFWFEHYSGRSMVIYGHDARRGLQDHRPYTLGLDTGCVYGGQLTGYVLETDELVQVKAKSVYLPVSG